jgi:hypothetical protein
MKYEDALRILEIGEFNDEDLEIEDIKKKYKTMALMYHPDRNNAENATEKFQEIHAAYECLVNYYEDVIDSDDDYDPTSEFENLDKNSYRGMLYSFLKNILKEDNKGKNIFYTIIQKISSTCEENSIEILRKLDKNVLIKTYELLKKYSKVLHFGDEFIEKVSEMISDKMKNDECIILNPTLEDLFENNLYRLTVNEFVYIVPLWHRELVYDNSGNDVYVRCEHIMPENVTLGPNNNLIVSVVIDVNQIWADGVYKFFIGKREFEIPIEKLRLSPRQVILLNWQGISRINTKDIYDISNKGDIIVNVKLEI